MATTKRPEQIRLVWRKIDELIPYEHNAKLHPQEQLDKLVGSFDEFGRIVPAGIDRDGNLIYGHGRILAARQRGDTDFPCIEIDGLSETQRRAFVHADNLLSQSGTDEEILRAEMQALQAAGFDVSITGFDPAGLVLGEEDAAAPEILEDDFDEDPPEEPRTKRGQIWQLGEHRLMCGDATSADDMRKLLGGELCNMVFTDPPYNVGGNSKNYAADCSKSIEAISKAEWDKDFDPDLSLCNMKTFFADAVTVYICTSHFLAGRIWDWMKVWSDHYFYCVWSKPNPMPSLSKRHWTWNTELICYATRGTHVFNFPSSGHALSTWTIAKRNGDTGHPTEKPIEVPATAVSHSSNQGDIVLDPFGGSGSTLIACEQLGRRCRMMEIDPHYCDVIIDRWEAFTGKKAVLLDG